MERKEKTYNSEAVDVTYDLKRCIHVAACVQGLSQVFDTKKRPWIQPDQADADAVAEVVERCPTGALHHTRKDGGAAEAAPQTNAIRIAKDGPLFVRGNVSIINAAGEVLLNDTRMALCRCGASQNKPLCDNAHLDAKFEDDGLPAAAGEDFSPDTNGVELGVKPAEDGPLLLQGDFILLNSQNEPIFKGEKAALCRCGASSNKPFCDGTHTKIGFTSR